jgi:hypothetical protein
MAQFIDGPDELQLFAIQVIQYSEWIIPASLLFVVAWVRFNSPPTNRSGTTFALFSLGVIFYYALIIALWLVVAIAISQGSIGLSQFGIFQFKLEGHGEIEQYKPIFAALIIVVASQFPTIDRIDGAARSFCVSLAAIPREADRIALELTQTSFLPKNGELREQITQFISENVGPEALRFARDSSLEARFTRTIGLYCLFIAPKNSGTQLAFPAGAHARSAYAAIMQLGEAMATRAEERYEELIQAGIAYFASKQSGSQPTKEANGLSRAITDESNLICSLIARYVLFCDKTAVGRRQRLSNMGFDPSHPMPSFGIDKWAMTIAAVMLLTVIIMTMTPGAKPIAGGMVLSIAITFAVSIGFAVMGSILVAQRFIERLENSGSAFPPFAELFVAALIVAGLSVVLRIAIPLLPALLHSGSSGFDDVMTQFTQRWPGVIVPFACTLSLGLLCSYLGPLVWSWQRVSIVAAVANGIACGAAGFIVASLLSNGVLAQFYEHPEHAKAIIVVNTSVIGAVIGAMVLAAFRKSERARRDVAERVAHTPYPVLPEYHAPATVGKIGVAPRADAAQNLGGYTRANTTGLEGRYLCLRPAFFSSGVINAYIFAIRWEDTESCLIFEEQGRVDAGYTQRGRIYIPDGKPYMSLVTIERGAIRVIMVSRPEGGQAARGLIMTLSNPGGVQFTPVSAPVVLKRLGEATPQLGFIKPDSPNYPAYWQELEAVMPDYGFFSVATDGRAGDKTRPAKLVEEGRFTVVR